jgi:predicted phage terminase large subunit-like protein
MTRWHSKDLSGRIENHYTSIGKRVRKVLYKALQDDGTMLCDEILSKDTYKIRVLSNSEHSAEIMAANYQQEPIDVRGKLYSSFKTYADRPAFTGIRSYTDTADEGTDFLCNIVYGVYDHEAYIIDVLYTQKPMEVTEPAVADMLIRNKVDLAIIESNSGGRGFARNVERIMQERRNYYTVVRWFHQSLNKVARILTNSTWVMEHIYFPEDWKQRWPEFYDALNTYQQAGKNRNDDAPDAITGVAERMTKKGSDLGPINVRM